MKRKAKPTGKALSTPQDLTNTVSGDANPFAGAFPTDSTSPTFDYPPVIANDQVLNILSYYFSKLIPAEEFLLRTIIADESYLTVPPPWVRNCILTDPILAPKKYQKEVFDCDDYVQYLKTKMDLYAAAKQFPAPIAVGYLLTKIHAFSF